MATGLGEPAGTGPTQASCTSLGPGESSFGPDGDFAFNMGYTLTHMDIIATKAGEICCDKNNPKTATFGLKLFKNFYDDFTALECLGHDSDDRVGCTEMELECQRMLFCGTYTYPGLDPSGTDLLSSVGDKHQAGIDQYRIQEDGIDPRHCYAAHPNGLKSMPSWENFVQECSVVANLG